MGLQRRGEHRAHRPRSGSLHQPERDTEPGVVVDAGDRLQLRAVGQPHPAHHVQLPQLHRLAALPAAILPPSPPALPPGQPQPAQRPPDRGHTRHRVKPLPAQPVGQPRRPPARMLYPQLHQPRLHHRAHLMRTPPRPMRPVDQALQPRPGVAAQPRVQPLPRHPHLRRRLGHRHSVLNDRQHRQVPLLGHAQLPHPDHLRTQPKGSKAIMSRINRAGVNHQPNTLSSISRSHFVKDQPSADTAGSGPRGARTHNPRIKSPLLCQLELEAQMLLG